MSIGGDRIGMTAAGIVDGQFQASPFAVGIDTWQLHCRMVFTIVGVGKRTCHGAVVGYAPGFAFVGGIEHFHLVALQVPSEGVVVVAVVVIHTASPFSIGRDTEYLVVVGRFQYHRAHRCLSPCRHAAEETNNHCINVSHCNIL